MAAPAEPVAPELLASLPLDVLERMANDFRQRATALARQASVAQSNAALLARTIKRRRRQERGE